MHRYIIHLKDGVNTYYAGSDIVASNVWTSSPGMATRWKTEDEANTMKHNIASAFRLPGQYTTRRIFIPDVPVYDGVR